MNPVLNPVSSSISIYIHWPFCLALCPYCDFNSHINNNINHSQWLDNYLQELNYFADKIRGRVVKSIFFGGGTPSLMAPFVVEGIIQKIAELGMVSNAAEITLEANPTSFEINKFKEFKAAGVNRISLGIQSLIEQDLKFLGRKHTAGEAIKAIELAGTIFNNFSFDLIYGRPRQSLKAWQWEIELAMSIAGEHISLYQLTIEKGTAFYKLYKEGQIILPSDEEMAQMYEWTNNYLAATGYHRYEISNYAKNNRYSVHNLSYWQYDEYLGIGPGAHSRLHSLPEIETVMMWHLPNKWLNNVLEKKHGIQNRALLKPQEIIEEAVMMGLRLTEGISIDKLQNLTNHQFDRIFNLKNIELYIEQGLIISEADKISLTDKGLMLHNYLVPRILNQPSRG